jgi:hypothetical protein
LDGYISIAKVIGAILLPLIGIVVVLFSLVAFVAPFGTNLKDKTQRIKGFGLDLEVSVLTLFVLIGLTLSLSGIYLITRDYEAKLNELSEYRVKLARAEEDFSRALAQARQFDVTALLKLEDDGNHPDPADLRCGLRLFIGPTRPLTVEAGIKAGQYSVTIHSITQETVIRALECQHTKTKRQWILEQFNPLSPEYSLPKPKP